MDVIVGCGEVGLPWLKLVSKVRKTVGVDLDPDKCVGEWNGENIDILHVCIPYNDEFVNTVVDYALKFKPKCVVIHSTIKPFTTKKIEEDDRLPRSVKIIYSPMRGVYSRMELDMKRYDKFYASYNDSCELYEQLLSNMEIVGYKADNPHTLEYAKTLTDTTYYGFLIAYAMKTEEIAQKYGINYNEMWMFAYQIEQFLGNRPPCGLVGGGKIYPDPQGIRGHCILPNLELVKEDLGEVYDLIHKINNDCIERHKPKK